MYRLLRITTVASLMPLIFACASTPQETAEEQTADAPEAFVRAEAEADYRVNAPETASVYVYGHGENAAVARLILEPNAAVPEHRDETEEYIFVLEGRGVITIEGEAHEVEPGALIFMPAGALVSFQNGDERLVGVQIFAGPEPIEKYDDWNPSDAPPSLSVDATDGDDKYKRWGSDTDGDDEYKRWDSDSEEHEYTCAMHPKVRQAEAGTCPVCGMDLVVAKESAPESQSPQRAFLARFENAVNDHDWEALLSEMVAPDYVSQQHDDFLDGRTEQFISEMFYPGLLEIDNEECQGYVRNETHADKISQIEDFTVDALDGQEIRFSFSIPQPACSFEGMLWLREGDGDGDYGVVGASG